MSTTNSGFNNKTTGDEVVSAFADRVKGRIFVVTGPSAGGIGGATLTALAQGHPRALVLAGRTPSKFQSIVDQITKTDANIKVVLVKLDLSSIAATRQAVQELLANPDVPHIDVLINNAGIMGNDFEKTVDGIESQFGTCHIGHFLFTNLLLPKLRSATDPIVVNLTSVGHRFGSGDFSDVNFERRKYDRWVAYGNAKCANVLFSVGLSERGIKSIAVHPGYVGSELGRYLTPGSTLGMLWKAARTPNFGLLSSSPKKTIEEGSSTSLVAALDPAVPAASYMVDCQVANDPAPQAVDKGNAGKLWELSNKLTNESFA